MCVIFSILYLQCAKSLSLDRRCSEYILWKQITSLQNLVALHYLKKNFKSKESVCRRKQILLLSLYKWTVMARAINSLVHLGVLLRSTVALFQLCTQVKTQNEGSTILRLNCCWKVCAQWSQGVLWPHPQPWQLAAQDHSLYIGTHPLLGPDTARKKNSIPYDMTGNC